MINQLPDFDEFSHAVYSDWKTEAVKLLKGEDPDIKLQWTSIDPLLLRSYYDQSDLKNLGYIKEFFSQSKPNRWIQYETIQVNSIKEANILAKEGLMNGCEGVLFKGIFQPQDFGMFLDGIKTEHCYVGFENLTKKELTLEDSIIGLGGFGHYVKSDHSNFLDHMIEDTPDGNLISRTSSLINRFLGYIEQKGAYAFSNTVFKLVIGPDFFHEIARLRTLRLLTGKLANQLNISSPNVSIHAEPVVGNSESDHLLKQTTAGLSALLGGADSIAFQAGKPEWAGKGAHRISRNIGNLIRHESKLGEIGDAAQGAYFVDYLTDQFARTVWDRVSKKESYG